MKITEIKRKGKSEVYKLFVDGSFYSLFLAEIIVKHHIKINDEINSEVLQEYKKESDMLLCKTMALSYVSKALKTEKQVRDYLKKYGFESIAICDAISKLKEYGYLNDEYYAKLLSNSLSSSRGKRYIKNELKQKGIAEEKIDVALNELKNEDDACFSQAGKWLKGKELPLDKKNKEKLYRFLLGRGFGYDTIKTVLNKIDNNLLNEDEYFN